MARCCTIIGTFIYLTYVIEETIEMSMICRLIGHKFQNTLVIREDEDFYEVDDAVYCSLCGFVHSKPLAG